MTENTDIGATPNTDVTDLNQAIIDAAADAVKGKFGAWVELVTALDARDTAMSVPSSIHQSFKMNVELRPANQGEFYVDINNTINTWTLNQPSPTPLPVIISVEPT